MPIITLGLLSLCAVAYKSITIVIETELSNSMLVSVGKSAESINRWLATIMIEPETIASTPAAKSINKNFQAFDLQNLNRHKILHKKYPDIFQDIYAANSNGEYHTILQKGNEFSLFVGNIANRPYFKSIMAGGPTQITPPLISRTTGIPTIFMVAPILDEHNKPQGLVGAGISLKYIQEIAQELKAGKTGYGFIIGQDGRYIYHPESRFIMNATITEREELSERSLGNYMISGGSGMYRYSQNGRHMVAFYQPIPITNWSVATVLPEAELFAPAVKMMKLLIVITICFVCLIGAAIVYAMHRLTMPLQRLSARILQIAAGNFEGPPLDIKSRDEIGRLSEFFNDMVDSLETEKSEVKSLIAKLKESEALFRSQFEFGNIGIAITEPDETLVRANAQLCRMLGYTEEELYGKTWPELFSTQGEKEGRDCFNHMLAGEIDNYELDTQMMKKGGDSIHVHLNVSCFRNRDRSVRFVIESILDITARKQAERSLQESQIRFKALHNASFGGIAIHDKGIILECNQGLAEMSGHPISELIGMNCLALIAEKSRNKVMEKILARYEKPYEAIGLRRNGDEFPIRIEARNIPYKEKNVRVAEFRDITEQKLAEAEREKLQDQLIQARKMEAMGTLAGGIAHDFNNILSGIFGYSQLAKNHLNSPEKAGNDIDNVIEGAKRAAELVRQILTFSRKSTHEKQPIAIFTIVKEALKLLRASIPTSIKIKESIVSTATVMADPTKVHQVLLNLCTNAYHSMLETGGILAVGLTDEEISEQDSIPELSIKPGRYIRLEISDTGHGMDTGTREKIFEPYFTTKTPDKGTGLGLAVVFGIVKEHNGYINVYSEPGQGTTFHVYFPIIEKEPESYSVEETGETPATGTERILLVDDEETILKSTQGLLQELGYEVKPVPDGIIAFETYESNPDLFDLVITDMTMPGISGFELSRKILELRPEQPIILCTGHSEVINREKALDIGIRSYFEKPVAVRKIARAIRAALD